MTDKHYENTSKNLTTDFETEITSIKIEKPYGYKFDGCANCKHDEDTEAICIMRGCVHAVPYLTECFKPKEK